MSAAAHATPSTSTVWQPASEQPRPASSFVRPRRRPRCRYPVRQERRARSSRTCRRCPPSSRREDARPDDLGAERGEPGERNGRVTRPAGRAVEPASLTRSRFSWGVRAATIERDAPTATFSATATRSPSPCRTRAAGRSRASAPTHRARDVAAIEEAEPRRRLRGCCPPNAPTTGSVAPMSIVGGSRQRRRT